MLTHSLGTGSASELGRSPRGFRAFCEVQKYAVDRVPSGTVGFSLGGVGLIRRRNETVSNEYFPLPRGRGKGSMTNLDAHFDKPPLELGGSATGDLITDKSHDPGCDSS